MKKNHIITLLIISMSIFLYGCTESTQTIDEPIEQKAQIIELEENPQEKCNELSENNKILLNSPCINQSLRGSFSLKGKIINTTEEVNLKFIQEGEEVYEQKLIPEPSSAAGDFKILKDNIKIPEDIKGNLTLQIIQEEEIVEIPIVII